MLYRLGLLAVRLRWAIVAFWIALFAVALLFAPRVSSILKGGFGESNTEARQALDLMQERLGIGEASVLVAFQSTSLDARDPAYRRQVEEALAPLRGLRQVVEIVTPYTSGGSSFIAPDGRTSFALVVLNTTTDEAMDLVPELRAKLAPTELRRWVTGGVPLFADLNAASERDLRRAEVVTLPLVLLALVVVFGTLVAAALPVIMGVVSVVIALAIIYLVGLRLDVSIFVLNITSLLGLGIAIDYSLLMVSRFRQELAQRDTLDAVAVTAQQAGRAILFSAITSILGLSGLLLFDFMMLRSLGLGGVLVVFLSLAINLTLIPAIFSLLGNRVNALSVLPRRVTEGHLWHRIATTVMRRPILVAVTVAVPLVLLGYPFLNVNIGAPWARMVPSNTESREGWDVLEDAFGPGELAPHLLVVTAEGSILAPDNIAALYEFTRALSTDPRITRVESIVTLDSSITLEQYQRLYANPDAIPFPRVKEALDDLASDDTTMIRAYGQAGPGTDEAESLVEDLRALEPGPGLSLFVGGATADLMDAVDAMYRDFPRVVLYVMATIYLTLLILFRSVVLPVKAVIMNAMSIFATYGALVWIFQEGHLGSLFNIQADGFTEATIPILLFCIIFGISMDYEVFLLSRVKEAYDESGDNRRSVAEGLEHTGRVITSAAMILVLVAGSFATADVVVVKALGVGIAIAIFLDATVVRALLVPSLMVLLGRWNWWAPVWLQRLLPEWKRP